MSKLYLDDDRYGYPTSVLVEAVHNCMQELVRNKFAESGDTWSNFVFGSCDKLITAKEIAEVEARILKSGYRFTASSVVSQRDAPEIYKPLEGISEDLASFTFRHPEAVTGDPDKEGRAQRGIGDNVVRYKQNLRGIARYIRSSDHVIKYMREGVPPDTIAIIDDSGGTLTAPILEKFKGVICAGGTVRSHLGILTREYGIPCLMNARIDGIFDGDTVEMEVTATPKSADDYQRGIEVTARIWRIES